MDTTLSEIYFDCLCRTCMIQLVETTTLDANSKAQQQWQFIFDTIEECDTLRITELLSNTVPQIQMQPSDELPKKICYKCLQQLLSAYRFQQMCIQSEEQLRALISKSQTDPKTTIIEDETKGNGPDLNQLKKLPPSSPPHNFRGVFVHLPPEAAHKANQEQITPEAAHTNIDPLQKADALLEHGKDSQNDASEFIKSEPIEDDEQPYIENSNDDTMHSTISVTKVEDMPIESDEQQLDESSSQHICHICNKSFKEPTYLRYHLKRHNIDGEEIKMHVRRNQTFEYYLFKCDTCNRRFHKEESLNNHRLVHDEKADSKMYCHTCDLCGKMYITPRSLARHIRKRHPKEESQKKVEKTEKPLLACDLCGKTYRKQHNLENHKKTQHSTGKPKAVLKPNSCDFCERAFQCPAALRNHIRTHTRERPFLCPECGKSFLSKSTLTQHRLRHSEDKPFECPYCPLRFRSKEDVAKHKLIHEGIKRHVCDICDKKFGKSDQLKRHKVIHTGEKPHKCDFCEKRFSRIEHLRVHLRTHTGEKPYKCQYCPRAFAQTTDRIKHLRTHLGENVYRCTLCPLAFRLDSEWRIHFTTHKNEDPETRERNMKALKEEEAKLQLKLAEKIV